MDVPPAMPDVQPEAPQTARMSLAARLLNVFAVPGEVFDEVRNAPPSLNNWLVPVILTALVGALAAFIMFSQPAIQQQLREQQAKAMDKQVEAGKMTREQADQAQAIMEKFTGPAMLRIFGGIGALFASVVHVLWWALILWLLGKWLLKAHFRFTKALEIAGLAMMIGVLGAIVGILLTVNLARMFATPSLALAISDFDVTRKSHLFLGAANVFSFWLVGVMSMGLAKLAQVPFPRAAFLVFGYWVFQESLFILIGLGQFAL